MKLYTTKDSPSAEKLRGGYYTPTPIARFLARWVGESGPKILEPSCGDGQILTELSDVVGPEQLEAVELFREEAEKATRSTGVQVAVGDFFEWFEDEAWGSFDGVAGNPPYIRFGHWPEPARGPAMNFMERAELAPSRLTNAWVPFTAASILAVRSGGRIGLVLPAELMQVSYAAQLREFLMSRCAHLTLVSFRRLVFEGVLQEVVLLLAERGPGPATIRTYELGDASELSNISPTDAGAEAPMLSHDREKWTKYFLKPHQIELLRRIRSDAQLPELGLHASVEVGVVTGRNSFFTMRPTEAAERGIDAWCRPLVARSNQLAGLTYTGADLSRHRSSDVRCMLLALDDDMFDDEGEVITHLPGRTVPEIAALMDYLESGRAGDVPDGYKCSIRRNWAVVPSTWIPDGFMLRQIHHHPVLTANDTQAVSTDTVHRVRLLGSATARQLSAAAFNSATFAFAEILGRSYGGGILELEPSEARSLPVVNPHAIEPELAAQLDVLVRAGEGHEALNLADKALLIQGLGWEEDAVTSLREAWTLLRDRRQRRGRSSG